MVSKAIPVAGPNAVLLTQFFPVAFCHAVTFSDVFQHPFKKQKNTEVTVKLQEEAEDFYFSEVPKIRVPGILVSP